MSISSYGLVQMIDASFTLVWLAVLLAPAACVALVQNLPYVPNHWYDTKPLGCPFCLAFWFCLMYSAALTGCASVPAAVTSFGLFFPSSFTSTLLVMTAAPWAYRWPDKDHDD